MGSNPTSGTDVAPLPPESPAFVPLGISCHIDGTVRLLNCSEPSVWVRGPVLVVSLQVSAFGLIAPTLVLCEDGAGHRAIEPAISLCCRQGQAESSEATPPRTPAAIADEGCANSCKDTSLFTGVDATVPKSLGPPSVAVALIPAVTPPPSPAPGFMAKHAAYVSAPCALRLHRSTVLRI